MDIEILDQKEALKLINERAIKTKRHSPRHGLVLECADWIRSFVSEFRRTFTLADLRARSKKGFPGAKDKRYTYVIVAEAAHWLADCGELERIRIKNRPYFAAKGVKIDVKVARTQKEQAIELVPLLQEKLSNMPPVFTYADIVAKRWKGLTKLALVRLVCAELCDTRQIRKLKERQNGRTVFCKKGFSPTEKELREIRRPLRKRSSRVSTGYSSRHDARLKFLREWASGMGIDWDEENDEEELLARLRQSHEDFHDRVIDSGNSSDSMVKGAHKTAIYNDGWKDGVTFVMSNLNKRGGKR